MPRTLSDKAQEIFDDMPEHYRSDPMAQAVVQAYSNELQRIEDAAVAINAALFPIQADDVEIPYTGSVARMLSLWETMLNLPVAPAGIPLTDRRAKVLAHIQKRNSGRGLDWVSIITEALGSNSWSYLEGPGSYEVSILIPFVSGSYSATQLLNLLPEITPAHLVLSVGYSTGFLVGISLIGTDLL